MKILVAGSSGLVGTALIKEFQRAGHEMVRLVRRAAKESEVEWDPSQGVLDANAISGFDGVIHLGGESIAEGRWNDARKKQIRNSRVNSTSLLAGKIAEADEKPHFFLCASAIGFYGDRGNEILTEESSVGSGFLPEVCREWEEATHTAADAGVRVVNVRIGVVLAKDGGALAKILTPFKLGLGGIVGNGQQYWSTVALDELVSIFRYCAEHDSIAGPVNAVAPNAPTNYQFTKDLGRVLGRPTLIPLPGFAARIMLGEMADALLLASARVEPKKLQGAGYRFLHTNNESSLRAVL